MVTIPRRDCKCYHCKVDRARSYHMNIFQLRCKSPRYYYLSDCHELFGEESQHLGSVDSKISGHSPPTAPSPPPSGRRASSCPHNFFIMPRFFDDYSNTYLTHDSAAGRKQQRRGWKFRENFKVGEGKELKKVLSILELLKWENFHHISCTPNILHYPFSLLMMLMLLLFAIS